ncbi:MAG: glycosyl transferase [Rhodobacterales bacterium]|nr:MAG: glycosyl transferase [Rhodobacterales bacterium]
MPGVTLIIPAHDEAAYIGPCLEAILASNPKPGSGSGSLPVPLPVEVIVVANGCSDDTAMRARAFAPRFAAMGWDFQVLELAQGGKMGALNAGDKAARHGARAYLDADVVVSKPLLDQVGRALQTRRAAYVSGRCEIAPAKSAITRAYGRTYARVPFMTTGVPGCGFFAVNAEGRRRWGLFPDIISDDTFVRLCFTPQERIGVAAPYSWPLVEGWRALVKVRARQDRGVAQIRETYPQILGNDDKPRLGVAGKLLLALRDPFGFAVYAGVALATRFDRSGDGWSRGR